MPVENFRRRTFSRYVGRVWAPLASFPPLVKTPRDKRFDLVTDARVTLGLPEIRVITYVWKGAVDRVAKEKWSASRAVKVVSLANETNIRADRVDKRRERAAQGGVEKKEDREKRRRFFGARAKTHQGV